MNHNTVPILCSIPKDLIVLAKCSVSWLEQAKARKTKFDTLEELVVSSRDTARLLVLSGDNAVCGDDLCIDTQI